MWSQHKILGVALPISKSNLSNCFQQGAICQMDREPSPPPNLNAIEGCLALVQNNFHPIFHPLLNSLCHYYVVQLLSLRNPVKQWLKQDKICFSCGRFGGPGLLNAQGPRLFHPPAGLLLRGPGWLPSSCHHMCIPAVRKEE